MSQYDVLEWFYFEYKMNGVKKMTCSKIVVECSANLGISDLAVKTALRKLEYWSFIRRDFSSFTEPVGERVRYSITERGINTAYNLLSKKDKSLDSHGIPQYILQKDKLIGEEKLTTTK